MLTILATIAFTVSPVPATSPDTPPPFPIVVDSLKSREDIIAASRLVNWTQPPTSLVLPTLTNHEQVMKYINQNYPTRLDSTKAVLPWTWVFIDDQGVPTDVQLLRSSGHAALDSLAVSAVRLARFAPAVLGLTAVSLRTPIPVQVTPTKLGEDKGIDPERPHFVPYTVKPELLNRDEANRALLKEYPPDLRQKKIGGTILVWLLVDENGRVTKAQVRESSGSVQLDAAALSVSQVMRFSPAKLREQTVAVWITIPIVFKVF
jgi:TonB family protein